MNLSKLLAFAKRFAMSDTVTAGFAQPLDSEKATIVYLPEGEHVINAMVGGKPKELTVTVDQRVLASFQEDLDKRKESNVRPFAGFDHDKGAASFIPLEFRYEEGVGLLLDVEWTRAGREAIEGKDYSYFSPSFRQLNGIPSGLTMRGEIGSLVNDPAFEEIPRIAAHHTPTNENMEILTELGLVPEGTEDDKIVEAAKATLKELREQADKVEAMQAEAYEKAKVEAMEGEEEESELEMLKKQNAQLLAKIAKMEEEASAAAASRAASLVEEAVKAGRIAPKDEASISFWKQQLADNPDAIQALNAVPANPVLDGKTVFAGRAEAREIAKEISRAEFDSLSAAEKSHFAKSGGKINE